MMGRKGAELSPPLFKTGRSHSQHLTRRQSSYKAKQLEIERPPPTSPQAQEKKKNFQNL